MEKSDVIGDTLERLAPAQSFLSDWDDVRERAGETGPPPSPGWQPRTRWLLAAIAVAAVSSLGALAATDDLWLSDGRAPTPSRPAPLVVKTGSWDGQDWLLVAYRSESGDLCYSMRPSSAGFWGDTGPATSCGPFESKPGNAPSAEGGIAFLSDVSPELPMYVVGPVVDTAEEVVIHFASGEVLTTATFEVPAPLGAVRFYATSIPDDLARNSVVEKLVGLSRDGAVVACLRVGEAGTCD